MGVLFIYNSFNRYIYANRRDPFHLFSILGMKKFIQHSILFSFFALAFYICAVFVFGSYTLRNLKPNINFKLGGNTYSRLIEVKKIDSIDILFLGSSHSYRGFDTRIFKKNGLNTFNLGSSAQTPIQTQILLKRYLDRLQPQLIIYEVYPPTLSIDGVESSLDIISNDKNDIYSFQMAIHINKIRTYNTLLYATTRKLLQLDNNFSTPKEKEKDLYIKGGFVEKEISYYQPQSIPKNEIILNETQLKTFVKTLDIIKKKNIKLLLVYAPITKSLYRSYTNNTYFDSLMHRSGNYYNFNEMINLVDTLHFYDSHHLNQKGVRLFNEKIIKLIDE